MIFGARETVASDLLLLHDLGCSLIPLEFPDSDTLRSVPEKPAGVSLAEKRGIAVGRFAALGKQCAAIMVRASNAQRLSDADTPVGAHIGHDVFVAYTDYIQSRGIGNLKFVGTERFPSHSEPVDQIRRFNHAVARHPENPVVGVEYRVESWPSVLNTPFL